MATQSPRPRRSLVVFLGLAGLVFASGLNLRAQRTGALVGQLILPGGGLPPQAILVELQVRGAPIKSDYSDSQGRFGFIELPYNSYRVVVKDDNYVAASELIVVRPELGPASVRLVLRRRESQKSQAPPKPAFGGNPHLAGLSEYMSRFSRRSVKEFEAGVKADQAGKPDKAIRHYRKAIELAPDLYPAHNNLGSIYLTKRDFEAAESEFAQVIELNPSDAQAYFNLGNVLLLTNRYQGAEKTLQEGLQREPNSGFGHFLLGSVCVRTGEFAVAEHHLRAALALDPKMSTVRLELVNLYLRQQRPADAVSELKNFVELFPDDPMAPKAKQILEQLERQNPPPS